MKSYKFQDRHNGPNEDEIRDMLTVIGNQSIEELISNTIPDSIRLTEELSLIHI